jgi:hypothetical protein
VNSRFPFETGKSVSLRLDAVDLVGCLWNPRRAKWLIARPIETCSLWASALATA